MVSMIPIATKIDLSTIDWKGYVSTALFLRGCNLRCAYCQNYELLDPDHPLLDTEEVVEEIRNNRFIDAVVVSGGEPTIHGDGLVEFLKLLKSTGKKVKLDTNGTRPDVLEKCLPFVDVVAMDIKTDKIRYRKYIGADVKKIKESVSLLLDWDGEYEFRCTLVYPFVSPENIESIKELVRYRPITFQEARLDDVLNPSFPMCRIEEKDLNIS